MNKNSDNGVLLSVELSCVVDRFAARLSLSDLSLASSIIARSFNVSPKMKDGASGSTSSSVSPGTLSGEPNLPGEFKVGNRGRTDTADTSAEPESHDTSAALVEITVVTVYDMSLSTGLLSTVIVNDFHGQSLPLFRATCEQVDIHVTGTPDRLMGMGSMDTEASFYNPLVSRWEPVVETFPLTLEIDTSTCKVDLKVRVNTLLQVNVSGMLLRTAMRALSSTQREDESMREKALRKREVAKQRRHDERIAALSQGRGGLGLGRAAQHTYQHTYGSDGEISTVSSPPTQGLLGINKLRLPSLRLSDSEVDHLMATESESEAENEDFDEDSEERYEDDEGKRGLESGADEVPKLRPSYISQKLGRSFHKVTLGDDLTVSYG